MENFRNGIQSLVAYHKEVYWDHFYLYYMLMIWQTWIQVITGQIYICLLMMQKYVDILHVQMIIDRKSVV